MISLSTIFCDCLPWQKFSSPRICLYDMSHKMHNAEKMDTWKIISRELWEILVLINLDTCHQHVVQRDWRKGVVRTEFGRTCSYQCQLEVVLWGYFHGRCCRIKLFFLIIPLPSQYSSIFQQCCFFFIHYQYIVNIMYDASTESAMPTCL